MAFEHITAVTKLPDDGIEYDNKIYVTSLAQAKQVLRDYYGDSWDYVARSNRLDQYDIHGLEDQRRLRVRVGKTTFCFGYGLLFFDFTFSPTYDQYASIYQSTGGLSYDKFPTIDQVHMILDLEPKPKPSNKVITEIKFAWKDIRYKWNSSNLRYRLRRFGMQTSKKYKTAEELKADIDKYISTRWPTMFKASADWVIAPCYETDTKWQRDFGELRFKVYEPKECEGCLPLEQRSGIDAKFHRIDNKSGTNYIRFMSATKKNIRKLLEEFDTVTEQYLRKVKPPEQNPEIEHQLKELKNRLSNLRNGKK